MVDQPARPTFVVGETVQVRPELETTSLAGETGEVVAPANDAGTVLVSLHSRPGRLAFAATELRSFDPTSRDVSLRP
jgi:hypothetical protein